MVFSGYISLYRKVAEWFENPTRIKFYNRAETIQFLGEDRDAYMLELTDLDLRARRSISYENYRQKAMASAVNFTEKEKQMMERAVEKANRFFANLENIYIDKEKMKGIPWKFAMTQGKEYENGLPHTREDTIFLTPSILRMPEDELVRTLIHEKVHVFQRAYRSWFQEKLAEMGYIQWRRRTGYPRIRSNPDVDEFIYIHPTKEIMVMVYRTGQPESIQDAISPNSLHEHPNEEVAYTIASRYPEQS